MAAASHLSTMTHQELFDYIQHLEHSLSYERFLREKLEKKLVVASAAADDVEPGTLHRDEVIVAPVAPVVARVEEDRKTMSEEELRRRYFPIPENKDKDYTAHLWTYHGKPYLAIYNGFVYHLHDDGSIGDWVGIYDIRNDFLDTSVPEPEYDDEETDNDE